MYRSGPGVRGRIYVVYASVPVGKTCVNKFMQQRTWFWVGVVQGSWGRDQAALYMYQLMVGKFYKPDMLFSQQ